jgi:hypothetical protein
MKVEEIKELNNRLEGVLLELNQVLGKVRDRGAFARVTVVDRDCSDGTETIGVNASMFVPATVAIQE